MGSKDQLNRPYTDGYSCLSPGLTITVLTGFVGQLNRARTLLSLPRSVSLTSLRCRVYHHGTGI